jgi:tRNA threonylcarbamoyladenosine biosynthesis protein TsaB
MRILAIDTSCGAASVAVVESGLEEPLAMMSRLMARGHAEALAPMVEEVMRGLDGGFATLSRIAVATGPGSFTGIRVGLAMARAMAVALAIPVVGVSTLAAFAAPLLTAPRPGIIAAAIDARHGSVYFQLFETSGRPLGPPRCDTARECVRAIGAGPAWLAGDAAAVIANEAHRAGLPYDLDAARDAPDIVALAWMGLAVDPVTNPARPIYVKPPDARPNPAETIARAPAGIGS